MRFESLSTALGRSYRLERELGQGGMATVYLAEDLKHHRKVAIKVLKPDLAAVLGAERFIQEITTTAALQHPHILPLFDSGTADGFLFYVMPYVEGETLRSKLDRERQLGIEESVRIAREVADALDYAHRHGVIHRDIKPENILLHDGRATVADFGIALAVSAAAGGRITETGLSLGTPHYMSPEQATAERELSGRSDIYSLGCVLYEMLTGNPPHVGATAQQIIMKIVTEEAAPVTKLRKAVPHHIADAVAQAVEKLPADRFESAKEFAEALRDDRFARSVVRGPMVTGSPSTLHRRSQVVFVAGVTLALVGTGLSLRSLVQPRPVMRAPVALTLDLPGANPDRTRFAVSAAGDAFAFATEEGLMVRAAGDREYRLLSGTRLAESPVFSPDGEWIAFHQQGRLRKVAVRGGSAVAIVTADTVFAGRVDWGESGSIAFESGNRILLIEREGDSPIALPATTGGQSPRLLPDGSGVLFVDSRAGMRLMFHDRRNGTSYRVLEESSQGQYVPSGHIVYAHPNGGLFAIAFDRDRRATFGVPTPIVPDLQANGSVAPFRVTAAGSLVYRAGLDPEARILLRRPNGRIDPLPLAPRILSYLRYAPDGRALALTIGSARGVNRHTAIYNLESGMLTQVTFEGGGHSPVWSPDGRLLVFSAEAEGSDAEDLFIQPVDRSAAPRRVVTMPGDQHANAWPSDSTIVFSSGGTPRTDMTGSGNVFLVDPRGSDRPVRGYLTAPWGEQDVAVSPNGRFGAYGSWETGRHEVYVRPFPDGATGGRWQVSFTGGRNARWSPDGGTIHYLGLDGSSIHSARLSAGPPFAVVSREVLVQMPFLESAWDVDSRTGTIAFTQAVTTGESRMIVIVNWLESLRRGDSR